MALKFGPPEYFSLMIVGLTILTFLASEAMWKALLTASFGIFLGSVGMDSFMATERFTFGILELSDGIGLVPVVMGLFGISEVLLNVEKTMKRSIYETAIKNLLPTLKDWQDSIFAILRGSVFGFFLGVLPGGGATISAFISYAMEKRFSKRPEKFGTGLIASMYIGNGMLLVLNLPLIGLWVNVLKVPYPILFPLILLFCLIGAYRLKTNTAPIFFMIFFGLLGYLFKKFRYEGAPLVLAFVLGPMLEKALRRSLLHSGGNPMVFFNRPISAVLLSIAIFLLIFPLIPKWGKKKSSFTE